MTEKKHRSAKIIAKNLKDSTPKRIAIQQKLDKAKRDVGHWRAKRNGMSQVFQPWDYDHYHKKMKAASRDTEKYQNELNSIVKQIKKLNDEYTEAYQYEETVEKDRQAKVITKGLKNFISENNKANFDSAKKMFWDDGLRNMAKSVFESPYNKEGQLKDKSLRSYGQQLKKRGEKDIQFGTDKSREGMSEQSEKAIAAKFQAGQAAASKASEASIKSLLAGQGMGGVGMNKMMNQMGEKMLEQKAKNTVKTEARDYQAKQEGIGEAAKKYTGEVARKEMAQDDLGVFEDSQRRFAISQAAAGKQYEFGLDSFKMETNMTLANQAMLDPEIDSMEALKAQLTSRGMYFEETDTEFIIKDRDKKKVKSISLA